MLGFTQFSFLVGGAAFMWMNSSHDRNHEVSGLGART